MRSHQPCVTEEDCDKKLRVCDTLKWQHWFNDRPNARDIECTIRLKRRHKCCEDLQWRISLILTRLCLLYIHRCGSSKYGHGYRNRVNRNKYNCRIPSLMVGRSVGTLCSFTFQYCLRRALATRALAYGITICRALFIFLFIHRFRYFYDFFSLSTHTRLNYDTRRRRCHCVRLCCIRPKDDSIHKKYVTFYGIKWNT